MPTEDPAGVEARYRFGPLERRGVVAGLGAGQVVSVAGALLVAVVVLRSVPSPVDLPVAVVAIGLGVGAAFVPVAGRTAEEWAPVLFRWVHQGLSGRHRWLTDHHLSGRRRGPGPPPVLAGCRVIQHDSEALGARVGVVFDARAGVYTAVLAVAGHGFPLLDRQEKERRLGAWSSLLAGLAREGSVLHRLQWVERSRPGEAGGLELSMLERLDPEAPADAAGSYRELVARAGPLTPRHETLLALSLSTAGCRRQLRAAGGGPVAAMELLAREVALLRSNLRGAEIEVDSVLGPAAVRQALSGGFGGASVPWRGPWPLAVEVGWSAVRTDAWWHATYWVAEWPRSDVGPDFLVPLLLLSSSVRAVSVTMEPVSPLRAAREVEAARTAGAADEELRRRGGFLTTARRQRTAEGMARREAELADGHSDFRFSGYVTVSAPDPDSLERSCGEVEQAAAQARLELRRLYGQQDEALTYTLPLTRGLR